MVLERLNVVSVMETTLPFCDHVRIKHPPTYTTNAHKFCDTQPTTSFALLRIQLMVSPMMPGNTSAAFVHNLPSSLAKALFKFVSNPLFCTFFFLRQRLNCCARSSTKKQSFNQNADSHSNSHEYGSNYNALLPQQCSYLLG